MMWLAALAGGAEALAALALRVVPARSAAETEPKQTGDRENLLLLGGMLAVALVAIRSSTDVLLGLYAAAYLGLFLFGAKLLASWVRRHDAPDPASGLLLQLLVVCGALGLLVLPILAGAS